MVLLVAAPAAMADVLRKGDCRELVITLDDGTEHRVLFHFK